MLVSLARLDRVALCLIQRLCVRANDAAGNLPFPSPFMYFHPLHIPTSKQIYIIFQARPTNHLNFSDMSSLCRTPSFAFRSTLFIPRATFSTSIRARKSAVDAAKDTLKSVDRTVSDAAVKGIETSRMYYFFYLLIRVNHHPRTWKSNQD